MNQEDNGQRYLAACHAIQSGVAFEHSQGSTDGTPKHLRTGINIAMCDHAALVKLLVAKGLFTDEEYTVGSGDGRAEMTKSWKKYVRYCVICGQNGPRTPYRDGYRIGYAHQRCIKRRKNTKSCSRTS